MPCVISGDDARELERMTTTRLSQRQDLLEGIHADGVLGYLIRHGVLDPAVLAGLGKKATVKEINSAILRQVERQGKPALTLLINALRQSWQLQLANSLDPDVRIHPTSGNGDFGNHRYKGELTIRIQIEALTVTTQENWQQVMTGGTITCQDLTSADTDSTQKVSQLNVTTTEELGESNDLNTRSRSDEVDGIPLEDENDEDFVKPKSCWCFCLFRKKKSKSKKYLAKQNTAEAYKLDKISTCDMNLGVSQNVNDKKMHLKHHRRKLKEKSKVKNKVRDSTLYKTSDKGEDIRSKEKDGNGKFLSSKSGISEGYLETEHINRLYNNQVDDSRSLSQVDVRIIRDETADVKIRGGGEMSRTDQLDSPLGLRDSRNHNVEHFHNLLHQPRIQTNTNLKIKSTSQTSNKDTLDSISTDNNHRLDLATVKVNNNDLIIPTRQSGKTYATCQVLTSADRGFKHKASKLCVKLTHELRTEIIKYFEQERGILIFDVTAQDNGITVACICMAHSHVRSLQQDVQSGSLLRKIEEMVAKVDMSMFEIQKVKLKIVVDDKEMGSVLGELS